MAQQHGAKKNTIYRFVLYWKNKWINNSDETKGNVSPYVTSLQKFIPITNKELNTDVQFIHLLIFLFYSYIPSLRLKKRKKTTHIFLCICYTLWFDCNVVWKDVCTHLIHTSHSHVTWKSFCLQGDYIAGVSKLCSVFLRKAWSEGSHTHFLYK